MADRRAAERLGRRAERLAALALQLKGYAILDRRARTGAGEIDLVARRGDVVAFVEVKARRTLEAGMTAVSPSAWRRIHRAAELWMAKRPDLHTAGWRYDVMIARPSRWPHHVRDAWRPDFAQ